MRFPVLLIAAALAAGAGCSTTETRTVKLNTVEAATADARNAAGEKLIDAIFAGDFAAARPLLEGGFTPEADFEAPFDMLHDAFLKSGKLQSRQLVTTLELSPYVNKLVYKLVLIDGGKDESGKTTEVKSEVLFVVSVVCDAQGRVIVVDFRPVA